MLFSCWTVQLYELLQVLQGVHAVRRQSTTLVKYGLSVIIIIFKLGIDLVKNY